MARFQEILSIMRILATAFAAGVLLSAGQASAASDPATAAAPPPPPPSTMPAPTSRTDPNTVICKREQSTESRLGGAKICHTRQEWNDMAAAARTSVDDMQQRGNLGIPPR
jgi:ABC-type transport system substrate-binding protein